MAVDQRAPDREAWGPTVTGGRSGRSTGRRVLLTVVVLIVALLLYGLGALLYANVRIDRVPVDDLATQLRSPVHFLVVGSDRRDELTREQQLELGVGGADGVRADTLFVLSIEARSSGMLAIPRDLQVVRCDGSTGRVNAAIGIDGPDCLVETVRDLTGIPLSGYIEVDFLGFVGIVDAVGGVEVCLDEPIADDDAHIDLPAGCQVLEGTDALGYVRVRKIDNDLMRIQRQQQFLRALADEVVSPGLLLNPIRLYGTAGQVGASMMGDRGLGPIDLTRFGLGMWQMARGNAVAHTVPTTPSGDVLVLDEAEARPLFASFQDGSVLREAGGSSEIQPEDVAVAVLNGAGVSGLAGQTAQVLEDAGFAVASVGNSDPVEATVIRHPPGMRNEAEFVADRTGRSVEIVEDGAVSTVTLVLGPDAAG